MRELSENFMDALQRGFLSGIRQTVVTDKDLDLHIRDNYLTLYYKGHSLLDLSEKEKGEHYQVAIHPKFREGIDVSDLKDEETTADFLNKIPAIKANIIKCEKSSLEMEYEQLIIRANNRESRNSSEYYIVDRQYTMSGWDNRFDLMGFFWSNKRRYKKQKVTPCLMEVKFALNTDIGQVSQQLERYYKLVQTNIAHIIDDLESTFHQRLDLGLYDQPSNRLKLMKTLEFERGIEHFQFLLILIDYNPYSTRLKQASLENLPFASQVKVFFGGFAMWEQELKSVSEISN